MITKTIKGHLKESSFVICYSLALLALVSCTLDYYEKGEGEYSLMRADLCIVRTDGSNNVHYAVTDDGDSLLLSEPYTAKWLKTPDSTYRALIYYNDISKSIETKDSKEPKTELISLSRIPSANIHKPDYFKKGIKTDPVNFESVWASKNRRYLNLGLVLMTGEVSEQSTHTLGIVGDTLIHHPNGTSTYHLRLYHDQGGVPQYYSQRTYFSIPLHNLSADSISLTVNTFRGIIEKRVSITPQ